MLPIILTLSLLSTGTQCDGNPGWDKLHEEKNSIYFARAIGATTLTLTLPNREKLIYEEMREVFKTGNSEGWSFKRTLQVITWEVSKVWHGEPTRILKTFEIGDFNPRQDETYLITPFEFDKEWVLKVKGAPDIVDTKKPVMSALTACAIFQSTVFQEPQITERALDILKKFPHLEFERSRWRTAP